MFNVIFITNEPDLGALQRINTLKEENAAPFYRKGEENKM
jgi:hypothetical protein